MEKNSILKFSLYFVGFVQVVLGLIFLLIPTNYASMMGLQQAPNWVNWMFTFMSIRMIGFGAGMFIAAKDPIKNKLWIQIMIVMQAMDWLGTVFYLTAGVVTLAQVTSASFLPLIFIALLVYSYPRPQASTA